LNGSDRSPLTFLRESFGFCSGFVRKKDVFTEELPKKCGKTVEESAASGTVIPQASASQQKRVCAYGTVDMAKKIRQDSAHFGIRHLEGEDIIGKNKLRNRVAALFCKKV